MEVDSHGVKMEDLHEYAELLHQSNDEGAKRMVSRVSGILEATDDAGRSTPHFAAVGGCLPILQLSISQNKTAADRPDGVVLNMELVSIAKTLQVDFHQRLEKKEHKETQNTITTPYFLHKKQECFAQNYEYCNWNPEA
uniref:ANK_REP_REGION domain-containing protein n=1 Tax=Angiostrongylus cantonensis TaxID=6313 RepID=A0A0K0DLH3_ANGCA